MKRTAVLLGALIIGFMITSCGNSVKDKMIADIDVYFNQVIENLAAIDNAEDFLDFAAKMSDGSDLENYLTERWDEDTKFSENDSNAILEHVKKKSTEYFLTEKNKCLEFVDPAIDEFNAIIDKMYPMYQANQRFDTETMEEFLDVFNYLNMFMDYDNILDVLEERLGDATDKMSEMTPVINQRLEEMNQ